jgi:hypothetical protein
VKIPDENAVYTRILSFSSSEVVNKTTITLNTVEDGKGRAKISFDSMIYPRETLPVRGMMKAYYLQLLGHK